MENKVIIIGGGPAGLAAAIYASRANLKPLLFAGSPPGGQLTLTSDVENYPGYTSILGPELIQKMREQAAKFGTRIVDQNIVKVDFSTSPFKVFTSDKEYESKTIIIATGANALWLGLESETRLRGKGVSACATCDGFFFKEKIVGVVGGGDTALEEALTLTKFAKKVYVIHRRDSFRASKIMSDRVINHEKIEILWNMGIEEVLGEMRVEGVRLKSVTNSTNSNQLQPVSTLSIDGLFVAIGHKPDTDIFKGQVELDEKGYILTTARVAEDYLLGKRELTAEKIAKFRKGEHHSYSTSVPGVFAAGDNVDHVYRQAATATGMGVAAALELEKYLEARS